MDNFDDAMQDGDYDAGSDVVTFPSRLLVRRAGAAARRLVAVLFLEAVAAQLWLSASESVHLARKTPGRMRTCRGCLLGAAGHGAVLAVQYVVLLAAA